MPQPFLLPSIQGICGNNGTGREAAMGDGTTPTDSRAALEGAGLPRETVARWLAARANLADESGTGNYARDAADFTAFWRIGDELLVVDTMQPLRENGIDMFHELGVVPVVAPQIG